MRSAYSMCPGHLISFHDPCMEARQEELLEARQRKGGNRAARRSRFRPGRQIQCASAAPFCPLRRVAHRRCRSPALLQRPLWSKRAKQSGAGGQSGKPASAEGVRKTRSDQTAAAHAAWGLFESLKFSGKTGVDLRTKLGHPARCQRCVSCQHPRADAAGAGLAGSNSMAGTPAGQLH